MLWPESVLVLDPELGHELTDKPGANAQNKPHNAWGWAQAEFEGSESSRSQVDTMLKIWRYRFDCLLTYRMKFRNTFSNYDHYNAAWVACGYIEDQPEKAIELCSLRFGSPTGEVLDDPNVGTRKKVPIKKVAKKR